MRLEWDRMGENQKVSGSSATSKFGDVHLVPQAHWPLMNLLRTSSDSMGFVPDLSASTSGHSRVQAWNDDGFKFQRCL